MRVIVVALAVGFAGSVALNVWWAVRARTEAPAPTPATLGDVQTCRAALRRCETARTKTTPSILLSSVAEPAAVGAASPFEIPRALIAPSAPSPDAALVSELTPDLQQDMLSQVAREKLRDEWKSREGSILSSLRTNLADRAKQHEDAEREGRKLAAVAGLDLASTEQFLEGYEARRMARLTVVGQALALNPPNWSTALVQVRGLFGDEDALVQSLGGNDARRRLRSAQAEGRTIILAIGASLANAPWEQVVRW